MQGIDDSGTFFLCHRPVNLVLKPGDLLALVMIPDPALKDDQCPTAIISHRIPCSGNINRRFQRTGLFEQMGGTRNNPQQLFASNTNLR